MIAKRRARACARRRSARRRAAWRERGVVVAICTDRSKVSDGRSPGPTVRSAHGRPRPDDPDPAMDPAGRPPRRARLRIPAREDARSRPVPVPHGRRDRVHAQSARPRPHAAESAPRAGRHPRLHDLPRRRRGSPRRDRRRRGRPGARGCGPGRRVRHRASRRAVRPPRSSTSTGSRRGSTTTASSRSRSASRSTSGWTGSAPARSPAMRRMRSRSPRELPSRSCSSCSRSS